jgi:hypothetical protein
MEKQNYIILGCLAISIFWILFYITVGLEFMKCPLIKKFFKVKNVKNFVENDII